MPLVNEVANIQKVGVTPLPRYLHGGCCGDQRHVTNRGGDNYVQKMMDAALDFRKWTREFFHKKKRVACGLWPRQTCSRWRRA